MFAVVLATLLVADTPKAKPVRLAPKPAVEAQSGTTSGPLLSSVAVTVECTARASGRVEDCRVLGETHPGLGFGETAVALMQRQAVAPAARDVQFARTIQFTP